MSINRNVTKTEMSLKSEILQNRKYHENKNITKN